MKNFLLLFLLVLFNLNSFSNPQKEDRFSILKINLTSAVKNNDDYSVKVYSDSIIQNFIEFEDKKVAVDNIHDYINIFANLYVNGQYSTIALQSFLKIKNLDSLFIKNIYINDSTYINFLIAKWEIDNYYLKNYNQAINSLLKALKLAEKSDNKKAINKINDCFSISFEMIGDYHNALLYWRKSGNFDIKMTGRVVKLFIKTQQIDSLEILLSNSEYPISDKFYPFAPYYIEKGNYKKALSCYKNQVTHSLQSNFLIENQSVILPYFDFAMDMIEMKPDTLIKYYIPNEGLQDTNYIRTVILDSLRNLMYDYYDAFCKGNINDNVSGKLRISKLLFLRSQYLGTNEYQEALEIAEDAYIELNEFQILR